MLNAPQTPVLIPADPDPWLTLQQAAAEVNCHEATLRRLIKAGIMRHARVGPGKQRIRIRRSWLSAAMEACAMPIEVGR
jgi:excisionase family DNA binding protein